MKCIIAGSRTITQYKHVVDAVSKSRFEITAIGNGKARGADRLGEQYGIQNNIPVIDFPAEWDRLGKKAGPLRNIRMGEWADCAIIIWDGSSTGSKHMIEVMKRLKKPYHIELVMDDPEVSKEYVGLGFSRNGSGNV